MSAAEASPPKQTRVGKRSDWPVCLGAEAVRRVFLTHLFGENYRDKATPLSDQTRKILWRFYRALIQPHGQMRTHLWLQQYYAMQNETQRIWKEVWGWEETEKYLKQFPSFWREPKESWQSEPHLPAADERCRLLLDLFENMLGVAVMRPVVGDMPELSDVYYAAIDHPSFNDDFDETKQLILESVVVPPGQGSVGQCFKSEDGARVISISFGDYAGVVEWQDLIQGQVSILMATRRAVTAKRPNEISVQLWLMLFFPVAFVFDDELPLGVGAHLET